MTAVEEKKYLGMETVLQGINKSYVSLEGDKVKRNNPIMKEVLHCITFQTLMIKPIRALDYRTDFDTKNETAESAFYFNVHHHILWWKFLRWPESR